MNNNGGDQPSRKRRSSFAEEFYNAAAYTDLNNLDQNEPFLHEQEADELGQLYPSNPTLRAHEL